MDKFTKYVDEITRIWHLEPVKELKTLDDCSNWFTQYKKQLKTRGSSNAEWTTCRYELQEIFDFDINKKTKNVCYNALRSLFVNKLFITYVKEA